MMTIGVTGVSGFVGRRFLQYNNNRYKLIALPLRNTPVHEIDLREIDAIVHLAGKAHQMEPIADEIYFDVNYKLSKELADSARQQGVKHFVYISSTKVYGDETEEVLTEQSVCHPSDAYGASKLKAEQYLQSIANENFIVSVIRPPLVYGPAVKGNMIKLLNLAAKKIPLPFGEIHNGRSMVFIDNLIEMINTVIIQKSGGVFVAGDAAPLSTSRLIQLMRVSLGNKSRLISIPGILRRLIKAIKPALYIRLFGSFIVDNEYTNSQLGFNPPYSTEFGIGEMVKWYVTNHPAKSN